MDKNERQQIALQRWKDYKGRAGFQHPTGFGKMYETINIIKRMLEKNMELKVIIVVDSDPLRTQWKEKISESINPYFLSNNCLIETIQYFQNKRLLHYCHLIILDEMSKYFSEDRQNIWNGNWVNFKFLLWLDATPEDKNKRDIVFYDNYPCCDKITQQEAEKNGWITTTKVINIGVDFTEEELENYKKAENTIDENFGKFDRDFSLIEKCLHGVEENGVFTPAYEYCKQLSTIKGCNPEYLEYVVGGFPRNYSKELIEWVKDIVTIWAPDKLLGYAKKTMAAIRNRKEIIYTASKKVEAVIDCLNYYPNMQTIIFSQRTNFASTICQAINNQYYEDIAVEYHSNIKSKPLRVNSNGELTLIGNGDYATYVTGKKKGEIKIFGEKTIKDVTIAEVASGKAKVIVTGSALDRGLDIPKISLGIVVGFTENESQHTQRRGRLTRLDLTNNNKEAIIINIYVKGTKEESFLRYSLRDTNCYWLNSIEELDKKDEYDI